MSKITSFKPVATGKYTVVTADATAGKKDFTVDLPVITGAIVQVLRSDIVMASIKVTYATDVLTVATNGSTYVVTAGDVIDYICF